ncbi:MAG: putative colanic acid biosynthesis acetyltransferase [Bacteroidia bacterium]|nr:putative colanic acid biosynthesis acetyltransferase [Bacteroidia bacterium]
MLSSHDINNSDAYQRPVFGLTDKLYRLVWNITWLIFCKWTPRPLHRYRIFFLRLFGAKIGKNNFVYPSASVWSPRLLETEEVVTIGPDVEVYNPGGVYLGHHSIISQGAYICGATHNYNSKDFDYVKKKIILEPYVWICARAIVLPGSICHEGSVLGAGSILSSHMTDWSVYSGNPAKNVKQRKNFLKD